MVLQYVLSCYIYSFELSSAAFGTVQVDLDIVCSCDCESSAVSLLFNKYLDLSTKLHALRFILFARQVLNLVCTQENLHFLF
jgi:hypothetical protein